MERSQILVKSMEKSTKKQIRREMIKKRKTLTKEEQIKSAKACTKKVLEMEVFQKAKAILVYLSYQGEMMTDYLIDEARRQGKVVAAPTVLGQEMEFYTFSSREELFPERHGILEPVANEERKISQKDEETLVIMPGVAFDEERNRVGYGGGFYDRYFKRHPNLSKIAIAYEFQIIDFVPAEEFDEKPDWIVTEDRVIEKNSNNEIFSIPSCFFKKSMI